jgi:hypothetical protein
MDDGNGVVFTIVYSGSLPYTVVKNLTAGVIYSFKVSAVNINGEGPESTVSTLVSCVAPSGVEHPVLVSSTATTVSLRWMQPNDMGGCYVFNYQMYNDDGLNGAFVLSTDSPLISNQPYLFEYTFTLGAGFTSRIVRFKLEAYNVAGSSLSIDFLSAIIAGVPSDPTSGPVNIPSITNSSLIGLQLPIITSDGGSPIVKYRLYIDNGLNGGFSVVDSGYDSLKTDY